MSLVFGGPGSINPSTISPLTNYIWKTQYNGQMDFGKDGEIRVKPTDHGNHIQGRWTLASPTSFRTIGLLQTEMGVSQDVAEIEEKVIELLTKSESIPFKIIPGVDSDDRASLIIGEQNGDDFVMKGEKKPEVRFGTTGIDAYIRIRPTLPGEGFTSKYMICDVEQRDHGITMVTSDWRPYDGDIVNLREPQGQEILTLRVKKYSIPQEKLGNDPKASKFALYFDAVVNREGLVGSGREDAMGGRF